MTSLDSEPPDARGDSQPQPEADGQPDGGPAGSAANPDAGGSAGTALAAPAGQTLRRHWRWFAVAAGVVLAGVAALVIPGHGSAFSTATGAPASGPASTGAGQTGTGAAPAGTTAHSAGAHGSTDPAAVPVQVPRKVAAALARWTAGRGGAELAAVSANVGDATQSAGGGLYAPMKYACAKLTPAVAAAKAGPPIPDTDMQRQYAEALTVLARASADCQTAITVHSYGEGVHTSQQPAVLRRSVSEFAAGARHLYLATAQLKNLPGHEGSG